MSITNETPAPVDPVAARLSCIKIAAEKEFKLDENTPDWLKEGVSRMLSGEAVDAEWLGEFDKENSVV